MASQPKAFVTGRRAVLKALLELGEAAPEIAEAAVTEGVKPFKTEMDRRAPVDSGSMKSRINIRVKRKSTNVTASVNTPPEAVFTEYGFIHKRSGKRVEAKPWIRPSFDLKVGDVEKDTLEHMAKGIEAAAAKAAGGEDDGGA